MDEVDGFEVLTQCIDFPDKPKVIVVSANPVYLNLAEGLDLVETTMQKPVNFSELPKLLNRLQIV